MQQRSIHLTPLMNNRLNNTEQEFDDLMELVNGLRTNADLSQYGFYIFDNDPDPRTGEPYRSVLIDADKNDESSERVFSGSPAEGIRWLKSGDEMDYQLIYTLCDMGVSFCIDAFGDRGSFKLVKRILEFIRRMELGFGLDFHQRFFIFKRLVVAFGIDNDLTARSYCVELFADLESPDKLEQFLDGLDRKRGREEVANNG